MAGGKPLKFKTVEELQSKIDDYFESCLSPYITKSGDIARDDEGKIIKVQTKPYTVVGLALFLECDRKTLLNYSKREKYFPTVARAKQKIEVYTNERLFDKEGERGAKFSLINNFEDYADKKENVIANREGENFRVEEMSLVEKLNLIEAIKNEQY